MFPARVSRGILALALAELGEFHEAVAVGARGRADRARRSTTATASPSCAASWARYTPCGATSPGRCRFSRGAWSCAAPWAPGSSCPGRPHSWDWRAPTRGGRSTQVCCSTRPWTRRQATTRRVWTKAVAAAGYQRIGRLERAAEVAEVALAPSARAWGARPPRRGRRTSSVRSPRPRATRRGPRRPSATTEAVAVSSGVPRHAPPRRPLPPRPRQALPPHGDHAKAQEHLTTAATMYREMGMTFWLEKADAELGGVER